MPHHVLDSVFCQGRPAVRGGMTRFIIDVALRVPFVDVLKSDILALFPNGNLQVILRKGLKCHMTRLVIHPDAHAADISLAVFIDAFLGLHSGSLYVVFIALDTGFVLFIWVNLAPTLLRQERKLCVAYIARAICVHVPIKLLNVFKADFQAEKVDSLSELVDRNRLRVVRVNVAEGLSQVSEPLIDFE